MLANGRFKWNIKEKWQARILNVELISLLLTPGVIARIKGGSKNLAVEGGAQWTFVSAPSSLLQVTFLLNVLIKYLHGFISMNSCMFWTFFFFFFQRLVILSKLSIIRKRILYLR